MSIIVDVILIACGIAIVLASRRRGFFKTVISVGSLVASFLISMAFSPKLAVFLYDNFVLNKLADSITKTVSSIAVSDAPGTASTFDFSKLQSNTEFNEIVSRFGGSIEKINEYISGMTDNSSVGVEKVCRNVAAPLAQNVSTITAFIIIFVVSFIVLKVVLTLIGKVFKLPVIRDVDRLLGTIVGVFGAILMIIAVSIFASGIGQFLNAVSPKMFDSSFVENSLLVRFFSTFDLQNLVFNKTNFDI